MDVSLLVSLSDEFNRAKANTYAIAGRFQTAKKPETREKWMKRMLEMMAKVDRSHG